MKNNPKDMLVLKFISDHCAQLGYAPTRKEIANKFANGFTNGSQHYIQKLKNDDLLRVGTKGHRAIGITSKGKRLLKQWKGDSDESNSDKTS